MYATWENEEERSGRMVLVAGTDHSHKEGQKSCMICVSNMKDDLSAKFYRISFKAAQIKASRILLAMMRMFDHGGAFPQTKKKLTNKEMRRLKRDANKRTAELDLERTLAKNKELLKT